MKFISWFFKQTFFQFIIGLFIFYSFYALIFGLRKPKTEEILAIILCALVWTFIGFAGSQLDERKLRQQEKLKDGIRAYLNHPQR